MTLGNIATDRLREDADFGKKKSSFQMKLILILEAYNKQNCRIWGTKNPHAYIEKPTQPKPVTVC